MIIHSTGQLKTLKFLLKSLESIACWISKWFLNNQLKGNGDRFHVFLKTTELLQTSIQLKWEAIILKNYWESSLTIN